MLTRQFLSEVNIHRMFRAYFTRPLAANSPPPPPGPLHRRRPQQRDQDDAGHGHHHPPPTAAQRGEAWLVRLACVCTAAPKVGLGFASCIGSGLFSFRFDLVWNGDRPVREGKEPNPFFPSGWGDLFSLLQGRARALRSRRCVIPSPVRNAHQRDAPLSFPPVWISHVGEA